ncbi:hypothetical protein C1637_05740 [Chryseobacterium lactis]|uniref:DUF4932 domain-containing protein n=1 Tax=Chryseobacterium lactis TaxID=1241981 RepID=A0A3G6RTB7_CHRLC|nr:DUF4932 domain-containing protein [Chryseobacterium lactis]AZA84342.1 DUF4932 domain-containing protein [Chryseobacterium lactis]AZB04730.1 DUF4932 domain-containing protein [Chryseobacterium lactis]PNW14461.1 hypothetical protein C1637_05740 [Chryseobacterium lactis]
MERILITLFFLVLTTTNGKAQYIQKLSPKVQVGVNKNIETYFFAEKLAVEHIGYYVFDHNTVDYSHQPIVYFGFQHFKKYKEKPSILRIAELLRQIRDLLHDNGPILDHLLNQKDFPAEGQIYDGIQVKIDPQIKEHPEVEPMIKELTDSLRSFYTHADIGSFIKKNNAFYKGALTETAKDITPDSYQYMEKWYGQIFPGYMLYISPAMPITPGKDNYRGFGPNILSADGKIPSMVVSSSKMLPLQQNLASYRHFGFDNPKVTSFISGHEIGHTFVNPLLDIFKDQIQADSALYTHELAALVEKNNIRGWYVCLIEHLVRLGEIRVALAMKNPQEAERLRRIHIGEFKCVLIPMLEIKIAEYERNRIKYPTFESYLPKLLSYISSLTPEEINIQVSKYKNYKM